MLTAGSLFDLLTPMSSTNATHGTNYAPTSITHTKPAILKGEIYTGVVIGNLLPNNIIEVALDGYSGHVLPCVWAAGIISGLLGFKTHYIPPHNTKVLVLFISDTISYIIGSVPSIIASPIHRASSLTDPDVKSDTNYSKLKSFASRGSDTAPTFAGHKPPIDMVEGEINIENLMGVGLSLLRHLSSIHAGGLARVECHVLDDMVRIISDTFKHYTAFGEHRVYNDGGKLNAVWHGTSNEHEAIGNIRPTDPLMTLTGNKDHVDFSRSGLDTGLEEGRWRFSQYVGHLGNLVNIFITDPVATIGRIAEDQFRSGKARIHINDDGSILFQTVADIVLEKVVRIPVPIEKRRPDNPAGNRTDDGPKSAELLKSWTPSNPGNLFEMCFQLREYARWLNNSYSLGRFRQMDRDFKVPSEAETPPPDLSAWQPDKSAANAGTVNWRVGYSTIRIYRDGSIQTVDAYGNAITTTQIGIQISTPKDLLLQAAGSVNIVAGRDVNITARKNLTMTSILEKVRIKAQTGFQCLSVAGDFVLETLGDMLVKIIASVRVGDTLHIAKATGSLDSLGAITAQTVAAPLGHYVNEHFHHLDIKDPKIPAGSDTKFMFQTTYDAAPLYETVTQQMFGSGALSSVDIWNFEDNEVEGRGRPWPGNITELSAPAGAGDLLGIPSSKSEFSGVASPLVASSAKLNLPD